MSRSLNPLVSRPTVNSPSLRDQFFAPFEQEFNSFFDSFFNVNRKPLGHGLPKVDVYEQGNKFIIQYSIAGTDPSDVSIKIDENNKYLENGFSNRALIVSGKMEKEYEHSQNVNYHHRELSRKSFSRTMILPDYVKTDPVASYKNGMLTLTFDLPVQEEATPVVKTIPITVVEQEGK